ncbi:hypothetical protein D3C80_438990 [compost metagenome]
MRCRHLTSAMRERQSLQKSCAHCGKAFPARPSNATGPAETMQIQRVFSRSITRATSSRSKDRSTFHLLRMCRSRLCRLEHHPPGAASLPRLRTQSFLQHRTSMWPSIYAKTCVPLHNPMAAMRMTCACFPASASISRPHARKLKSCFPTPTRVATAPARLLIFGI